MRISDWSSDVCSSDLINSHLVRLFITKVQNLRKKTNLHPWNKITVFYNRIEQDINNDLCKLITNNKQFIEDRLRCRIDELINKTSFKDNYYAKDTLELNEDTSIQVMIELYD